jgi:hypothetical protein
MTSAVTLGLAAVVTVRWRRKERSWPTLLGIYVYTCLCLGAFLWWVYWRHLEAIGVFL